MQHLSRPALPLLAALLSASPILAQQPTVDVLDPGLHHLGDSHVTTWDDVPADPEGIRLDVRFEAQPNAGEFVLSLRHRNVDERWSLRLNGVEIGVLEKGKQMQLSRFLVAAGALQAGANWLSLTTAKTTDDIVVGDIRLHRGSLRHVLAMQPVRVQVRDDKGNALPAKVTITDRAGVLVDIYYAARLHTAIRKGICYTADGDAQLELPAGEYTLWASHGPEWGMDRKDIVVPRGKPGSAPVGPVQLAIRREVDTTGFVAADTHIHTLTHSGHGDASVEERMVTLAGEGVELAIATDHNHNTDYRPTQDRMGLNEHFTPVTGNEVTTKVGHMNAFPLDPSESPPDHTLENWIQLVDHIRAKGALVVILNHPRWPQIPTGPFGVYHLDRITGELPGREAVPFDAMELVNATTLQNDPMYLFVDWFALLNHGEHISAVGTSDSHTVGDPVGQGRTYVRSSTDDPAAIDLNNVCPSFVTGDSTISLGIYAELVACEHYYPGQVVTMQVRPEPRTAAISLRVAAPSWVRPRVARVFVNGTQVVEHAVPSVAGKPTDVRLPMQVPLPPHDAWVVCVVLGDGIKHAFWRTAKNYTLAATNPVFMDGDGGGTYQSPRALATELIARVGTDPGQLRLALEDFDDAVSIEVLALARAEYEAGVTDVGQLATARQRLAQLAGEPPTRGVFARYLASLPTPAAVFKAGRNR